MALSLVAACSSTPLPAWLRSDLLAGLLALLASVRRDRRLTRQFGCVWRDLARRFPHTRCRQVMDCLTRRATPMKKLRMIVVPCCMVAVLAIATVFAFGAHVSSASAAAGGNEVFHGKVMKPRPAKGASPAVTSSNMTYHGGPVSTVPKVYISWWGSQWNTG